MWINECNSNKGTDMEQMAAVIEMSDITKSHSDGGRVESFCFFVSTGRGNARKAEYVIHERAAHEMLGRWLAG